MSLAGFRPMKKAHKFGAKKTERDGIMFDSKAEADRYSELRLLEKAGKISHFVLQPRFILWTCGNETISYVADFQYVENEMRVVEDVKGVQTEAYRLKRKMFLATHPFTDFYEIHRGVRKRVTLGRKKAA